MLENTQPYTFEWNGKTHSIPAVKAIPSGIFRKTRHLINDEDRSFTIIEMLLGEDSDVLKALDEMSTSELSKVISEWTQGVSLGESSGSES